MPKHVIYKAQVPVPSASSALVSGYAQAYGILRQGVGPNRGPYQGQALDKMPKPITAQQYVEIADAPTQLSDVARNLFQSSSEARYWSGLVGTLIDGAANEIGFRQQLFETVRQGNLEPSVGKTLLRRSVQFYRRQRQTP